MRIFPGQKPGRWLLLVLALLLPVAGCGSTGSVSGTITINGTKLKGGKVAFYPVDGQGEAYGADIAEDGTYTVARCPVGPMKVCVQTAFMKPRSGNGPVKYEAPKDAPPGYRPPDLSGNLKHYVSIPPKYENPESSGLVYEVKSGAQTKDFELQ